LTIRKGASIEAVQRQLGHATASITLENSRVGGRRTVALASL
jgi:hypothetical protein